MIEQNFGDPVHPLDDAMIAEPVVDNRELNLEPLPDETPDDAITEPVVDNRELNPDLFTDETRVDAVLIPDAPLEETLAASDPIDETVVTEAPTSGVVPLLNPEDAEQLHKRWMEIQVKFVDDPQSAVQEADALVSEVVENIIQMFASEHNALEVQWNQGKDLSTEDLRKSLQHYRSFFNRIVG